MKVLKRKDITMAVHAAKYPNVFRRSYGTLVEGSRPTTIPLSGFGNILLKNYKIKVEILNIQINRSTAQTQTESVKIR